MNAQPTTLPFPIGFGSLRMTSKRGRIVHVRHLHAEDASLLIDLFHRLSPETRRLRFHSPLPDYPDALLQREARRLADLHPISADALVATTIEDLEEHAVAVARLAVDPADHSIVEGAIVVRDDYQNEGIGSQLFDLLIQVAMVRGHRVMRALSLEENKVVLRMIQRLGLPYTSRTSMGETTILIALHDE